MDGNPKVGKVLGFGDLSLLRNGIRNLKLTNSSLRVNPDLERAGRAQV